MNADSDARAEAMTRAYLGPVICRLLEEPDVKDILYRPTWVEVDRVESGLQPVPEARGTVRVVELLRLCGTRLAMQVPEQTEVVELNLPGYRARFAGVYVGRDGSESFFTIRRATVKGLDLREYVTRGIFDEDALAYLVAATRDPLHGILVSGPTSSGKTTLLASILKSIIANGRRREHLLVVEDTPELWLDGALVTSIVSSSRLTFRDALRATLRHRPDRVIVGEIRGGEALDAIKAGATGHGLMMTIHAESAETAVRMLCSRMAEGTSGHPDFQLVSQAIKTVVALTRQGDKFRVAEIVHLESIKGDQVVLRKALAS